MANVEDLSARRTQEERLPDRVATCQDRSAVAEDSRAILDRLLEERARDVAAEPRVPLTFRIGGIGHRAIEAGDIPALSTALDSIFDVVRAVARKALGDSTDAYRASSGLDLFVLTPLAEGADRLIARAGLDKGFRLGAVIPFAPEVYESTFDLSSNPRQATEEFRELLNLAALPNGYGVLALDGDVSAHTKIKAYRDCAAVLADWSDLLIAVLQGDRWGSETGISIRDAIDRGVAVVVIDPREPGRFLLAHSGELLEPEDSTPAKLESLIADLLAPAQVVRKEQSEFTGLQSYLHERIRLRDQVTSDYESVGPFRASTVAPLWVSPFRWLNPAIINLPQKFILWRLKRRLPAASRTHTWDLPFDRETGSVFVDLFLRQQRADAAANAYASLHRSGQILVVFLSLSIAMMAAFAANKTNPFLMALELVLLAYVLVVVMVAQRQRWLERWLDYRLIAEVLRCAKFLLASGRCALAPSVGRSFVARTESANWVFTYCRSVFRNLRLSMPGRSATVHPRSRAAVTDYLVHQCVDAQVTYHMETSSLRHAIEKALQWLAIGVLAASFAVLTVNVVIGFHFGGIDRALGALMHERLAVDIAASLPAIASAVLALRAYGEHMVIVRRSRAVLAVLELHRRQIAESNSVFALQQRLEASLVVQLRDVEGWFEIFSSKALEA
jgi:hypothetical protein